MDQSIQKLIDQAVNVHEQRVSDLQRKHDEREKRTIMDNITEWERVINLHIPKEFCPYVKFDKTVNPTHGGYSPARIELLPEVPILFSAINNSFCAIRYGHLTFNQESDLFEIEWQYSQWSPCINGAIADAVSFVEKNTAILDALSRCNADEEEKNRARRQNLPDPAKMPATKRYLDGWSREMDSSESDFKLALIECLDRIGDALDAANSI